MTGQPFFRSVSISNYRVLNKLRVPGFSRLNIVGGLNGSGKTSLLEALFMMLNVGSPTTLLQPFLVRAIPANVAVAANLLFHEGKSDVPVSIEAGTELGNISSIIERGALPPSVRSVPNVSFPAGQQLSQVGLTGITIRTSVDQVEQDVTHYFDMPSDHNPMGTAISKSNSQTMRLPSGLLSGRAGHTSPHEVASRFTSVVQTGSKQELVTLARSILPDCTDVALLQLGGVPQVCGVTGANQYLPLSLLGDGAAVALNIGLALLNLRNGVLLLDEFDTALHFSKLGSVWHQFASLARKLNCQIIAVTHSREFILEAAKALAGTDMENDLTYLRLDKLPEEIRATSYSARDLIDARDDAWEIR